MRSATAAELALLASHSRTTHSRIKIDRGGGDWVDMSAYFGVDWCEAWTFKEDVDNAISEATVRLCRSLDYRTLSPFVDGSELNQLGTIADLGNAITIETAVTPEGVTPVAADWKEIFRGEIEDVDWTNSPIELKCLDQGGALQSAFIETQQKYPVDPATSDAAEDIMQDILDDYGGSVVLWSPNGDGTPAFDPGDSPGWVVTEYIQKRESVLDALRTIAGAIGWDLRFRWQATAAAIKLQFFEPDRAKAGYDHSIGNYDYYSIKQCRLSRADIRNAVEVVYTNASGVHTSVLRTDAASIAKYGRRYMQVAEASTSQIDTSTEATAMADAILSDLAEPTMDKSAEMPFFWPVMLGDVFRFEANGVHSDTNQNLAVVGISHSFGNGKARTTLDCRGKPSGGAKRWLSLEARAGVAPSSDLLSKDAPTGGTGAPGAGSLSITFDDPRGMSPPITEWAYTECYVDDANPCVVDVNHLKAKGRQTRFDITGLTPGLTYYVKLRHIDTAGNVGATSAQIQVATEKVGSYHLNPETEFGASNLNPTFGIQTKDVTTTPPDAWAPVLGSWADSGGNWYISTTAKTGDRSLKLYTFAKPGAGTTTKRFQGDRFLVSGGGLYCVDFLWQHDGNTGNRVSWNPTLLWYDSAGAYISESNLANTLNTYDTSGGGLGSIFAASTWFLDRGWAVAPATACYGVFRISVYCNSAYGQANHPAMLWDYCFVSRSLAKLSVIGGGTDRSIAGAAWTQPWLSNSAVIDNCGAFSPGTSIVPAEHYYTVPYDGEYTIVFHGAFTAALNSGKKMACRILSGGSAIIDSESGADPGSLTGKPNHQVSIGPISLAAGASLTFEVCHNDSVNRSIDDSECKVTLMQTTNSKR